MFDIRKPIKIFVANGEVRFGSRVDNGFFPVFSVDTEAEAKVLVDTYPWACTDSLTSYAKRLEEADISNNPVVKFQNKYGNDDANAGLRRQTGAAVNSIAQAIMEEAKK